MDSGSRRELEILTTIAEGRPVTQRALAERLGIALGLANLYLKRLARKGYIKITTIPRNRVKYLVTPRGFAQKSRLTYEYMRYSLRLYREARQNLREALTPLVRDGLQRIALYGTGEAAELAYLTLREMRIEPTLVLDERAGGEFLGIPVHDVKAVAPEEYDALVVAALDPSEGVLVELARRGVPPSKLIPLARRATR